MLEFNGSDWLCPSRQANVLGAISNQTPFVIRHAGALFGARVSRLYETLATQLADERVPLVEIASKWQGRVGFRDDSFRPNFERTTLSYARFLQRLDQLANLENPPSIAIQTAPLDQYLREDWADYCCAIWPEVVPRVWVGNRTLTVAHYDDADNFACVVKGRRRFRLFPPNAARFLYVAPLEAAPSGAPITMVDPRMPNYERYPNYKQAEAMAMDVELHEEDALFIPALWWHEVESLESHNVLLNFWTNGTIDHTPLVHPIEALLLLRESLAGRSVAHRKAWQELFDAWGFEEEPLRHVESAKRGLLGSAGAECNAARVKRLISAISSKINK